jgi:hypothetical protein
LGSKRTLLNDFELQVSHQPNDPLFSTRNPFSQKPLLDATPTVSTAPCQKEHGNLLRQNAVFASALAIGFLFVIVKAAPAHAQRPTQFDHTISGILIVLHRGDYFEEFHGS